MNTETVNIIAKGDNFEIIVQHDQSGGSYGFTISKNAYDQLRNQMLSNVLSEQPKKDVIPYQCCPVCNGHGRVLADGFTSNVYQMCKVCNGAMIIPMSVSEITLKEE